MDSVHKHLFTPDGIILQQPAYSTYHIDVANHHGVSKGVRSLRVGDRRIEGNALPVAPAGSMVDGWVELE